MYRYLLTSNHSPVQEPSYSPEDNASPNVEVPAEKEDEEDEDEEEDDEEDEGEDKEDKEDKEEDKEDEEELTRVSYKEITGQFPEFFKKFPDLKHAFFREQQFTEIFPTVEDAQRAAEAQSAYEEIANSVIDGDANKFLQELKTENPDSLERFAENFLPALSEVNKNAYFNIITPQVQKFVKNVYAHGINEKDDNIKNAAKIVHKILFGGAYEDVEKDIPSVMRQDKVESEVDKDKQRYFNGKYQVLYKEITDLCYGKLEEEIAKGLSDLDKSNKGLKRILAGEIKSKVLSDMEKDAAYLGRMQSLWGREKRSGFGGQLKTSFLTTFMAKAKTMIGKHRSEVRREALGKEAGKNGDGATRISGGAQSKSGKGKAMTPERQRTEKLSTRQVFDD